MAKKTTSELTIADDFMFGAVKFRYILAENDLSKMVDDDKKMLSRIIYFIDNNPDMDNYDIAEEILNDEE